MEAALRSAVSDRLGEARFGLWFGDAVSLGVSRDGDSLEVRVPDSFFREWIRSHYATSLVEAAEAVLGRPLRLSIHVRDEAEPPVGDVVEPGQEPAEPRWGVVTVPIPGHPKTPLSFPAPAPSDPAPIVIPETDRPQPPRRTQGILVPGAAVSVAHRAGPPGGWRIS